VRVHSGGRQALERDALLEEVAILRHRLKLATAINEVCVLRMLCVCVYQSRLFSLSACVWLSLSVRAPLSGCVYCWRGAGGEGVSTLFVGLLETLPWPSLRCVLFVCVYTNQEWFVCACVVYPSSLSCVMCCVRVSNGDRV